MDYGSLWNPIHHAQKKFDEDKHSCNWINQYSSCKQPPVICLDALFVVKDRTAGKEGNVAAATFGHAKITWTYVMNAIVGCVTTASRLLQMIGVTHRQAVCATCAPEDRKWTSCRVFDKYNSTIAPMLDSEKSTSGVFDHCSHVHFYFIVLGSCCLDDV
jgi:hypothetical protein